MFIDVTILLPVYFKDDAKNFRTALKSILCQTFIPRQIIILVDGKIGDGLERVIEDFKLHKNISIARNTHNIGLASTLNKGLQLANYELIARMDSDDICDPNRIEKQFNFMNQNPECGICGTQTREFSIVPGDLGLSRTVPTSHSLIVKFMKFRCPFNHPTVMFRKSAVEKIGGYPKVFPEDYWLWWLLYKDGVIFSNLSEKLLDMRLGKHFMKRRGPKFLLGEIAIVFDMWRQGFIKNIEFPVILIFRIIIRASPLFLREWFFTKARSEYHNGK